MIDFDAFNAEILSVGAFGQEVVFTRSVSSALGALTDPGTMGAYTEPGVDGAYAGISDPVTIVGVFENAYLATQGIGEAGVGTSTSAITVLTSDVVDVRRGDTITVGTTMYYIVDPQPNGDGLTVLILSRDP